MQTRLESRHEGLGLGTRGVSCGVMNCGVFLVEVLFLKQPDISNASLDVSVDYMSWFTRFAYDSIISFSISL